VLPALETTELWCKQRVLLMPTLPVAREALTQRAIKAGVEGTTELVAEIGRDAEKTLILALDHPSSVRTPSSGGALRTRFSHEQELSPAAEESP
jgi:hypothetical protein